MYAFEASQCGTMLYFGDVKAPRLVVVKLDASHRHHVAYAVEFTLKYPIYSMFAKTLESEDWFESD
jgi:hypothetical protein